MQGRHNRRSFVISKRRNRSASHLVRRPRKTGAAKCRALPRPTHSACLLAADHANRAARAARTTRGHADRTGVRREGVIVREPPVDPDRLRREEPREEGKLLQVISEPVAPANRRKTGAGQRITDLQVVLAGPRWHLSHSTPSGGGIVAEGIVDEFPRLV